MLIIELSLKFLLVTLVGVWLKGTSQVTSQPVTDPGLTYQLAFEGVGNFEVIETI